LACLVEMDSKKKLNLFSNDLHNCISLSVHNVT